MVLNILTRVAYGQLPRWAQPEHPIMRTILGNKGQSTWQRRFLRFLVLVIIGVAAIGIGYVIANNDTPDGESPALRTILYWPLVGAQTIAILLGIALTTNTVANERQKQTWDSLKLSLNGVSLTLRARWMSVFFRLAPLLFLITLGRLVYLGLLLDEMVEFQGRALDLRISGITPEVSLDVTIIIMAAHMTAFILLPFVAVALAASIGLVMSVFTRTRSVVILGLLLLIGLRLATTAGTLILGEEVYEKTTGVTTKLATLEGTEAWYHLLLPAIEGDMMLKLLHLDTLGQIWADVENTIYTGALVLGIIILQAILANALVLFAAWRATKPTAY